MIKIEAYQCEKCGCTYNTADEAAECERSHRNIERITMAAYRTSDPYPEHVIAKFDDGSTREYRLWRKL